MDMVNKDITNNSESNKIYLSPSTSILHIAPLGLDSLFYARYWYISLKYGIFKYPTCISFKVTWRCVPFNNFLWIIFFSEFCLYLFVLANIFVPYCWYWSNLLLMVDLGIEICQVFDRLLILYLLDMENFLQSPY